jgi:hypothetical protein
MQLCGPRLSAMEASLFFNAWLPWLDVWDAWKIFFSRKLTERMGFGVTLVLVIRCYGWMFMDVYG